MENSSRYILLTGASIACTSMLYFFSLLCHVPFFISILFILAALFLLFKWLGYKNINNVSSQISLWSLVILAIGAFLITRQASAVAMKYGEWDAWAMWNYHAKHLADPANWKKMFQSIENDHADYPLCISGFLAFINRIFSGHFSLDSSFAFGYFFALAIPILIYSETAGKNMVIAIFSLYFFYQDTFFLSRTVAQYADTLLGFFFMGAFICMNHLHEDKRIIALIALLIGCCTWTKNEGCILAGVFCLFYAPVFLKNIGYFAAGIALPFITLIVYKSINPVHSDMMPKEFAHTKELLLTKARYKTIWDTFKITLHDKFNYIKLGVYMYAIICFLEKRLPGRQILIILTCLFIYLAIYVVTPNDLEWHLNSSLDRLMHQLMPATMYVLANKFSEIQFSLPRLQKEKS